jgi:hypothetical protein
MADGMGSLWMEEKSIDQGLVEIYTIAWSVD